MKITDATLACPKEREHVLFFDATEPGFGVRVTAGGKRVLLFQYRLGTLVRQQRIGVWGEGGLTAAKGRSLARQLRGKVQAGGDPVAERRAAQEAEAAKARDREFTFGSLISAWEQGISHRRPRYRNDAVNRLNLYFAGWKQRPASSITKREVVLAIDRIALERGMISSRRALAYARAAFNWALKRDMLVANPFDKVAAPGKETPRERVLAPAEIGAIWRAAESLPVFHRAYVRLLLLSLQRREEVGAMEWGELSNDLTTWTVPSARAKNGRQHVVHLAPVAQEMLHNLPRIDDSPYVFPGRSGPITTYSAIKAALDRVIAKECDAADLESLPPWIFHDFRRSGVSTLAGMGFPPHVCDRLLNHVTGAISGVAAVYQRHEFLSERQRALEAWATHVLSCAERRDAKADLIPFVRHSRRGL